MVGIAADTGITYRERSWMQTYTEEDVHQHIDKVGIEAILPPFYLNEKTTKKCTDDFEDEPFQLWRIIKEKALHKIYAAHNSMCDGEIIASKLNLPIDHTRHMELDFLGRCEDGLFILELKVKKAAERNAFTELLGYSNYFAQLFALSGHRDITNVLVAKLEAKITKQAYLYDLIINDRNTIVYAPLISNGNVSSLNLELYIPDDSDFEHFTNTLLGHEAMSCAVASFHDLDGWFDSEEINGNLNSWTTKHLGALSHYTSQLMEAESLHGFCFIRKRWSELNLFYENSLVICAINPFSSAETDRSEQLSRFLSHEKIGEIGDCASSGFIGRLIRLGQKAIKDGLTHDYSCNIEIPLWHVFQLEMLEVVCTHNFGFHPTGILRDAYVSYLNDEYEKEENGCSDMDLSILKVNEIYNWMKAWEFMRACGYTNET